MNPAEGRARSSRSRVYGESARARSRSFHEWLDLSPCGSRSRRFTLAARCSLLSRKRPNYCITTTDALGRKQTFAVAGSLIKCSDHADGPA